MTATTPFDGVDPVYSDRQIAALGVDRASLEICDQIGLAVMRIDGKAQVLSKLAQHWIGDELATFIASDTLRLAANMTDVGAQWDYGCESGRTVRMKRVVHGVRKWLLFHDVTLESDHGESLGATRKMSLGFLSYLPRTNKALIYGDFLDDILSPNEQLELRRTRFRSIIHPREVARFDTAVMRMLEGAEDISTVFECQCRRRPSFHLLVNMRAVRSTSGIVTKFVGGFRDVTAERQAQAELIRLRNEQAANAQARNFMVARIAHEIRTPLSGIVGMARAIERAVADRPDVVSQINILREAANDALQQIHVLSDRPSATDGFGAHNPVDLEIRTLLNECAALWSAKAEEAGVRMTVRVADNIPDKVELDALRVRQCLGNVLSNAARHTHSGSIQLVCGRTSQDGEDTLVIAVRDSGEGMDKAAMDRLFRPFSHSHARAMQVARTDGAAGGMGLGMSITRTLLQDMGGGIAIDSVLDRGTTVTMTLPLIEKAEAEPFSSHSLVDNILQSAPEDVPPGSNLRVLVADDNEANRHVAEMVLTEHVARVVMVPDGQAAIQALKEEAFDLILMDVHMPVMDGLEATLAIRESTADWADIPIIALTADTQYQQRRVVLNLGMDGVLAKPLTPSGLLDALASLNLDARERAA